MARLQPTTTVAHPASSSSSSLATSLSSHIRGGSNRPEKSPPVDNDVDDEYDDITGDDDTDDPERDLEAQVPLASSGRPRRQRRHQRRRRDTISSTTSSQRHRLRDPWSQKMHFADDDLHVTLALYTVSGLSRRLVYMLGSVLTLGLLPLVCRWSPQWWLRTFGTRVYAVDSSACLGACRADAVDDGAPSVVPMHPASTLWVLAENTWGQTHVVPLQHAPVHARLADLVPLVTVPLLNVADPILYHLFYIEYRCARLVWNPLTAAFASLADWKSPAWMTPSSAAPASLSPTSPSPHIQQQLEDVMVPPNVASERLRAFGPNSTVPPRRSIPELVVNEILHPFTIFQIASMILWAIDEYYQYALCILAITVFGSVDTTVQTHRNLERLREMGRLVCDVPVMRGGRWITLQSEDLVPGDVLSLAHLHTVPADIALVAGTAVIDESMLTGESVAVTKLPLPSLAHLAHLAAHHEHLTGPAGRSLLANGTRVMRARDDAVGIVLRTGFETAKGALVRGMLHPRPHDQSLESDAMHFLKLMAFFATLLAIYSVVVFSRLGLSPGMIALRALDLLTVVVPPALPASLSVGISFALRRLRRRDIFSSSPNRVNTAGVVSVVCFDKTGTITESSLAVLGVLPAPAASSVSAVPPASDDADGLVRDSETLWQCAPTLLLALACCHEVALLPTGEMTGDLLDVEMLQWTRFTMREEMQGMTFSPPPQLHQGGTSPATDGDIAAVKSYEFVPSLRRASVVARQRAGPFTVYTKGAPEAIVPLCSSGSVPADLTATVAALSHEGYRVLAVAARSMPGVTFAKINRMPRDDAEQDLTYLGLLVFENRMKRGSAAAIDALHEAEIGTMMISGDNIATCTHVARDSGIISRGATVYSPSAKGPNDDQQQLVWTNFDHAAVPESTTSGALDTLTVLLAMVTSTSPTEGAGASGVLVMEGAQLDAVLGSPYATRLLPHVKVLARASPEEKARFVEALQDLGHVAAFVGDGANDGSALKASDCGLSLSEAEASIAAPFTSRSHDISCIVSLIKEGRAAITTSFSAFQFMACYSLLQATSMSVLYTSNSNLGDTQFLFIDIGLIMPLAISMARSEAAPSLATRPPSRRLLSPAVTTSITLSVVIQAVFQVAIAQLVRFQSFYTPPTSNQEDRTVQCFENTAVFLLSCFCYISSAICYTAGGLYRSNRNLWFMAVVFVLVSVTLVLTFSTGGVLGEMFELEHLPPGFAVVLVGVAAMHFGLSVMVERVWIPRVFGMNTGDGCGGRDSASAGGYRKVGDERA
ncbi:hypothetical protein BC828DRAFT_386679 [Blastocladiella britannica]|nr:hypothetical protein BC828DRAFT_386679 [Blastocladiella britannica]